MTYERSIELYGDGIGKVEYVQHMGSDLTVVNSILAYWNTVVSPFVLLYLYIFVVSITVIELGRIMRSPEGILTLILNFMNLQSSERNTKATDKPPTQKN